MTRNRQSPNGPVAVAASVAARVSWHDLPEPVRADVQTRVGPVRAARSIDTGLNCMVAAILTTTAGRVFVKGMPSDHPRVWTQENEAKINPYVRPLSPLLRFHIDAAGWNLLGFDHHPGRPADLCPRSPDLAKIAQALQALAEIPCPDLPLRRIDERCARLAEPAALAQLAGDHLLHTDLSSTNILITDTAHLVDWAWPTRGAPWIDTALLIPRLIQAGHTPAQAEDWASRLPLWQTIPPRALDTVAAATANLWQQIAHDDPQPWKRDLATATQRWAAHRSRRPEGRLVRPALS